MQILSVTVQFEVLNEFYSYRKFIFHQLQELCDLHGSEQDEWDSPYDIVPGERGYSKSPGCQPHQKVRPPFISNSQISNIVLIKHGTQ